MGTSHWIDSVETRGKKHIAPILSLDSKLECPMCLKLGTSNFALVDPEISDTTSTEPTHRELATPGYPLLHIPPPLSGVF